MTGWGFRDRMGEISTGRYKMICEWRNIRKYKKRILLRFLIVHFTVSVSVTILPCGMVNTLGLVEESRLLEIKQSVKELFYYNIWFEVWISIVCIILIGYMIRFPREDTIVTLKVRMDN